MINSTIEDSSHQFYIVRPSKNVKTMFEVLISILENQLIPIFSYQGIVFNLAKHLDNDAKLFMYLLDVTELNTKRLDATNTGLTFSGKGIPFCQGCT